MAKATRARRPKKAASDAASQSPKVELPDTGPLALIETDLGHHVASIQPSDTALAKAKSPKSKAKATNDIHQPSPPWPLWEQAAPVKRSRFAWFSRLRAKQLSPLAATVAIAASCGAITGSLATVGVAKFLPLDVVTFTADADLAQQVARLDAEIVSLKTSLSAPAKSDAANLANTAEHPDQRSVADTTGSIREVPSPLPASVTMVQPAIIPVVDGWVLRNVYGGSALVEGRPGLIQVMPGDSLPGVGRVETIKREDGRWVVVTTRGLIVAR